MEYLFPYEFDPHAIAERLRRHDLTQALFNFPPGNWEAGERGIAALAGREAELDAAVSLGIDYARVIGATRLHLMAGILPDDAPLDRATHVYLENVRRAADTCAAHGIEVLLEPINHTDMPGYFLHTTSQAIAFIEHLSCPNVHLQFDLYHAQITEGDLARKIVSLAGRYAHVQIAGNPGRHEPNVGEINYTYLFDVLDETDYAGWVGCEYRPRAGTLPGLAWASPYLTTKPGSR